MGSLGVTDALLYEFQHPFPGRDYKLCASIFHRKGAHGSQGAVRVQKNSSGISRRSEDPAEIVNHLEAWALNVPGRRIFGLPRDALRTNGETESRKQSMWRPCRGHAN